MSTRPQLRVNGPRCHGARPGRSTNPGQVHDETCDLYAHLAMVWPSEPPPRQTSILGWAPLVLVVGGWHGVSSHYHLSWLPRTALGLALWWSWSKVAFALETRRLEALRKEWERKYTLPERDYTMGEIAQYDGSDTDKPIVIVVRGKVFNVSAGAQFYGRDGPYNIFAGRDATWLLAKNELELGTEEAMAQPLTEAEEGEVDHWFQHFSWKYELIGSVVDAEADGPQANGERS